VLKHLFDDFKGNINWEEDDDEDEDDANGMVAHTNSPKDKAWWMKKKHTEGSYHDLLSLPCLIVNRGGCVICVCLCVSLCQVCVAQPGISKFAGNIYHLGIFTTLVEYIAFLTRRKNSSNYCIFIRIEEY
jgi:hypothetical protein